MAKLTKNDRKIIDEIYKNPELRKKLGRTSKEQYEREVKEIRGSNMKDIKNRYAGVMTAWKNLPASNPSVSIRSSNLKLKKKKKYYCKTCKEDVLRYTLKSVDGKLKAFCFRCKNLIEEKNNGDKK